MDNGRVVVAPLPEGVRHGELLSPGLIGLVAYLKGACHLSYSSIQYFFAEVIREFKFLLTLPSAVAQKYGIRVLKIVRRMFGLWHRRADLGERYYRRALERARADLIKAGRSKSSHTEVRRLAKRFSSRFIDSYFTFMDHEGVDPTNNRTEQKIRFVVIDRKVTQGTKAEIGRQWCQRIWTTIASCRQQGQQLYHFITDAIKANLGLKHSYPSLVY